MVNTPRKLSALLLLLALAAFGLTACEQGPAEDAGEAIDQAVENTGDAVENATDEAASAIENAGDAANN